MAEPASKRILVVDDASLVRRYYRDALERAGFEVDEALNGVEALEKLLAEPADLLIVDVNMPQMDGFTFLQRRCAGRRRRSPSIPALVISTEAGPQDRRGRPLGRRQLLSREAGRPGRARRARLHHVRAAGMNEFVEQFLIEGRELVAQGNDDLLALEERPDDRERLDGAFRAFHTLKGAAGIVDFVAMARALHAAEDVLSAVRSNSAAGDAGVDRPVPGLSRPGRRLDRPDAGRAARFRPTPMPRPTTSSVASPRSRRPTRHLSPRAVLATRRGGLRTRPACRPSGATFSRRRS